ncbi:MAG TPA: glycosyltransferase family 9 protein [Bdellovibrionota bacterium]|nr:glycosyltransferase family 9 protein [Bdellovibrionota bacterium]
MKPRAPKKILAIKIRALGDTVLMTAPVAELRRAFPDAEIHVAADSRWAPILENHPAIDRIWKFERHRERFARTKAAAHLAFRLREQHFDCVINFHASPSSAMISRATGSPLRSIHFHGHLDKNKFSTVDIPGKGSLKPIIERDMDAVRALGIEIPAGKLPQLVLDSSEVYQAAARTQRDLLLPDPILGISLGASRPTKSWRVVHFAHLAVEWCLKESGSVFATAGPDESRIVRLFNDAVDAELARMIPDSTTRTSVRNRITADHSLSVRQLAALFSRFAVLAGNDSGPKHIAVAVNTPTVTLFGPEDPFEWHPYEKKKHPFFFVDKLDCRRDALPGMPPWCGVLECTEDHKCMNLIGVEQVLTECRRVARRSPGVKLEPE